MTGWPCKIKSGIASSLHLLHWILSLIIASSSVQEKFTHVSCLYPGLREGRTKPLPVWLLHWPMCFLCAAPNLDLIQCNTAWASAAQWAHNETSANTQSVIYIYFFFVWLCAFGIDIYFNITEHWQWLESLFEILLAGVSVVSHPWTRVNVDVLTGFICPETS